MSAKSLITFIGLILIYCVLVTASDEDFTGYVNWNTIEAGNGDPTGICAGKLVEIDCKHCCKENHYELFEFDDIHNNCECVQNNQETNRLALMNSM